MENNKIIKNSHPEPMSGCWIWIGSFGTDGYGRIWDGLKKKWLRAHRVSFAVFNREPSVAMVIAHSCDNRACVNPAHLRETTQRDNIQEAAAKGRLGKCFGEAHRSAKLNHEKVKQIRALYAAGGVGKRKLAKSFGVSKVVVMRILSGRGWRSVL